MLVQKSEFSLILYIDKYENMFYFSFPIQICSKYFYLVLCVTSTQYDIFHPIFHLWLLTKYETYVSRQ